MISSRLFACVFSLLFLASFSHAIISSEAALSKAQFYLKSGEKASILDSKFSVDGSNYWIVYFTPENEPNIKNLVVAVSADAGEIVSDEDLLHKIHLLDFRQSRLNSFTKDSLSVSDLSAWFGKYKAVIDNLNNPSSKTSMVFVGYSLQENYSVDLVKVQQALDSLSAKNSAVEEKIEKATQAQQAFESEKSLSALNSLISNYNKTLIELAKLRDANDAYASALLEAVLSVDASKRAIVSSYLQVIQVPDALSQELARISLKAQAFNRLFDGEDELVNDSVKSFFYRKEVIEKQKAAKSFFEVLSSRVQPVLNAYQLRQAYSECGVDVKKIEDSWKSVQGVAGTPVFSALATPAEYDQAISSMNVLQKLLDAADAKYSSCASASSKKAEKEFDYSQLMFPALVVVGLAALLFFLKKREKAETAPEREDEPAEPKSLWG
ncbi:MAG: hypothetical protein ACP5O3_00330 [Candidatus Micrarchaeia archaeon]